ncbi:MAG: DUF177 domain-containing protein [Candidatus Aegiribacteria sp.]|nr:DUF177 domain-containing protein [Candidatus Aegiribacteria sp.]
MKLDTVKLVIDLKSLSRGINRGVFTIPLEKIEWNIEGVEPFDRQGTLDLMVDLEDEAVLCSGRLDANFRTPCARCLKPTRFSIIEEIYREYAWSPDPASEEQREVISKSGELDIFDAVQEAVLLSIPGKPLCYPDCAGICYN